MLLNGWTTGNLARFLGSAGAAKGDWLLHGGLVHYAAKFGPVLGLSRANDWATHHTLAPYYASTLSAETEVAFAARLIDNGIGPKRPVAALALEEWFLPVPRLCIACAEVSEQTLGFTTIQRTWMLPYVTRCIEHGDVLMAAPTWSPALLQAVVPVPTIPGRAAQGLELAKRSAALLTSSQKQSEVLADLLQSRGFTGPKGRVRQAALIDLLLAFSEGKFEHPQLDAMTRSRSGVVKATRGFGRTRAHIHPLICALLIEALEGRCVIAPTLELSGSYQKKFDVLTRALTEGLNPSAAAEVAGVSVTTAVIHAESLGLTVKHKPKLIHTPLRNQIKTMLEKRVPIEEIAKSVGVSPASVYRVLRASPAIRVQLLASSKARLLRIRKTEWLAVAAENPEATITQLRALASATYAALRRQCPEFLTSLTYGSPAARPTRAVVRIPSGADEALAGRLTAAQKSIDEDGPRQTPYGLSAAAGRRSPVSTEPRWQASNEALSSAIESSAQFVHRRLGNVASEMLDCAQPLNGWRIVRVASLRPETVKQAGVHPEDVIASVLARTLKKEA